MAISGISGDLTLLQPNQASNTQQTAGVSGDTDGDNDGSRAAAANDGAGGPRAFLDAVFQALSQAGVSGNTVTPPTSEVNSSTTTQPSSTQNPLQALGTFMHDLLSALQAQGGQSASQGGSDSDGDSNGSGSAGASAASGTHRHHHGGGLAHVESNLQGLIQQLSASSSGSSATTAATSTNSTSTLQQDYQNLLSSLGASGDSSSLASFLQALSQNLQSIGSSGNLVNTQA